MSLCDHVDKRGRRCVLARGHDAYPTCVKLHEYDYPSIPTRICCSRSLIVSRLGATFADIQDLEVTITHRITSDKWWGRSDLYTTEFFSRFTRDTPREQSSHDRRSVFAWLRKALGDDAGRRKG